MTDRLMLPIRYRRMVENLLCEYVPNAEVWAYGSRVNGESHEASDLDLVVRGPALEPLGVEFIDLVEAIQGSNIPILVQAHDWANLPESFHREIERDYVVVQGVTTSEGANGWREVKLGNVATIVMGQSPPGDTVSNEPGVPLLNGPTEFGLHHPAPVQFTSAPRKFAQPNDVLFCVRGSTTGRMNWADQEYAIGRGVAAIRHIYDPTLQPLLRGAIELALPELLLSATGSTFPNVSASQIADIPYPDLSIRDQRAIAHVLGTLDDKIELNRRMNETLEAMARALFKSWFVDFEPVRAKMEGRWRRGESLPGLPAEHYDLFPDQLVNSELGEIPDGWEVKALGEVAKQRREGVKPHELNSDTPYIALEHMPKRCVALSEWGVADGLASGKFKFDQGDILFGKLRPYFHKVGVAPVDGVCSTDIVVVQPKSNLWFGLVLGQVSSGEFVNYTDATSTGTRMPRTNWPDMARYRVALPGIEVSKAFTGLVEPSVDRMVSAIHESRALAGQRDTLLPRLVSGAVSTGNYALTPQGTVR